MIVWRGATARTGGTVVLNVARELVAGNGGKYKSITMQEIIRLTALAPDEFKREVDLVLDGHVGFGGDDLFFSPIFSHPEFKVFYIQRDLRDALASFKRITRCDFEGCCASLKLYAETHQRYRELPPERCLTIPFSELSNLEKMAEKMSEFLGIKSDASAFRSIAENFDRKKINERSKVRMKSIMVELEALETEYDKVGGLQFQLALGDATVPVSLPITLIPAESRQALAKNEPIIYLRITLPVTGPVTFGANKDNETLRMIFETEESNEHLPLHFQGEPVSSYPNNDWRHAFTEKEAEIIDDLYRPIREDLGY